MAACSQWRSLMEHDWLVVSLVPFFEDGGMDVHSLWLLALEDELVALRAVVEDQCDFSLDRADQGASAVGRPNLQIVLEELQQLDAPPPYHPHRRLALLSMTLGPPPSSARECAQKLSQSPPQFVMYAAARWGRLASVVWLHHFSEYDPAKALDEAAMHGHTDVVAWLLDLLYPHTNVTVDFRDSDAPELGVMAWRTDTLFYTVTRKWGIEKSPFRYMPDVLAAACGDVEGVRKLLSHPIFGPAFDFRVAVAAASAGQLDVLAFLRAHCPRVFHKSDALLFAVQHGQLDAAKWVVAHTDSRQLDDVRVLVAATTEGHVHILEWMKAIHNVKRGGRGAFISVPHWLFETLATAASLHWLVAEANVEVTCQNAKAAIARQDVELTKWIVAQCIINGSFSDTHGIALLEMTIEVGNLELVRWFVEVYTLWSASAFSTASKGPSVETLTYIYAVACSKSPGVAMVPGTRTQLTAESLDTLVWLLDRNFRQGLLRRYALQTVETIEQGYRDYQRRLGTWDDYEHIVPSEDEEHRRDVDLMRDIVKLRRVVALLIEVYDPTFLRRVAWLPMWAMQQGRVDSLERLAEIGHPTVFAPALFRCLITQYRNESMVRWILEQRPELFSPHVVKWGVKHDKTTFLSWVFRRFLPVYSAKNRDSQLLRNCTRAAIWTAARYGRDDVLLAVRSWTSVASDPVLMRE